MEKPTTITWDYDEAREEVVGLTSIGLRARLPKGLTGDRRMDIV